MTVFSYHVRRLTWPRRQKMVCDGWDTKPGKFA